MKNQLVYDLPLRFFHWLFAGLFIAITLITKTVDDESPVFTYHMLAGLVLVGTVTLRLLWGFVGTTNSRFSSFALNPKDLVNYFKGILSGKKDKWAGHNPASSWAAIAMFVFAAGLGITGYLMATGEKETFKEVHELLANGFLVVVLMHIAGVILHMLRHQDGIAMAMVDGKKSNVPTSQTILNTEAATAWLFVGLMATFSLYLASNFDSQKQTLQIFGSTLQLGENEDSEKYENDKEESEQDQNGDKDDEGDEGHDNDEGAVDTK